MRKKTKTLRPLKAGETVIMTQGVYSDYGLEGIYRITRDLDLEAITRDWLQAHPEQVESYGFRQDLFLASLESSGAIEPMRYIEFHLADYGNASEMWIEEPIA